MGDCILKYIRQQVKQTHSEITIDQQQHIDELSSAEIPVYQDKSDVWNSKEKWELKANAGQINWIASQTRPDLAYDTCEISTSVDNATVGFPVHWTTSWDSYYVTVHLNESLSKVQKFTYLLSLFEETASDTVSGFTLTDSNYDSAVDLIHVRYSNKRLIISSHMEQLLQLPHITNEKHTKKFKKFANRWWKACIVLSHCFTDRTCARKSTFFI